MRRLDSWAELGEADARLLERCKAAITEAAPDAEVILYGSRARGEAAGDSDYDVIVVVDQPATTSLEDHIRASIYPLELETGAVLTLIVYNRQDWASALCRATPLRKNVEREGIVL